MELRERYQRLRREFLPEAPPVEDVTLEWSNRMTSSAGICYTRRKIIRLSTHYHGRYPEEIDPTLLHEMIHLIARGHGDRFHWWMGRAKDRGGEVTRHSKDRAQAVEASSWRYKCTNEECNWTIGRSRRISRNLREHGVCPQCKWPIKEVDQRERDVLPWGSVVSCGRHTEVRKGETTMNIREIVREAKAGNRAYNAKDGILPLTEEEIAQAKETEFPIHTSTMVVNWDETSRDHLKVKEGRKVTEDMLMWVGVRNYFTIDEFVQEAKEMGVCKRISSLPKGMIPGKTKLFLTHDEGRTGDAVIFGYVTLQEIQICVESEDEIPTELLGKVRPVLPEELRDEKERGCGFRNAEGGLYLVGKVGELEIIDPPVDYNELIDPEGRRFRGVKMVNGDAILAEDSPRKEYPTARISSVTPEITEGFDPSSVKKGDKWTEEEFKAIGKIMEEAPSRAWAFREYSRLTNEIRTVNGIESAWYKRKIKAEGDSE